MRPTPRADSQQSSQRTVLFACGSARRQNYSWFEMPKLLVFAPCEKVIISQDENNPTLIAILSEISGEIEAPAPLDSKGLAPMRWSIFSMWQQEDGDEKKDFEQTIRLISPSGHRAIDAPSEMKLTAPTHRVTAHLGTVPVGEPGDWVVQLFMYEKGQPIPAVPVATYPLRIRFTSRVVTAPESE